MNKRLSEGISLSSLKEDSVFVLVDNEAGQKSNAKITWKKLKGLIRTDAISQLANLKKATNGTATGFGELSKVTDQVWNMPEPFEDGSTVLFINGRLQPQRTESTDQQITIDFPVNNVKPFSVVVFYVPKNN